MTQAFALMGKAEADRFMDGKDDHPIRDVTKKIIGRQFVCDIGCGRGIRISELFAPQRYFGVDVSWGLINRASTDNPGYLFWNEDGEEFLRRFRRNVIPNILISSVFENMESLEDAQALYFEAARVAKRLIVGWNHPPHYDETEIIRVKAELNMLMNQNHYKEGSFDHEDLHTERQSVGSAEVWTVRRC